MTDDKGYLRCYDMSPIVSILEEHLPQDKKSKEKNNARHLVSLPKIPPTDMPYIWISRAHYEIVKSLEFMEGANILATTAYDKKVKLWDTEVGRLLDSF